MRQSSSARIASDASSSRIAGHAERVLPIEQLGELAPVGRPGGQGRVYRPVSNQAAHSPDPFVVKLYRRPPPAPSVQSLHEMVWWRWTLSEQDRAQLDRLTAWPLAVVTRSQAPVGIAMYDLAPRFEVPFVMPSGRSQQVLLSLEHMLGADDYLLLRGLPITLDTAARAQVAQRISEALAFLHRHAVVASDIAPNNLLVAFGPGGPRVSFIDCDSMVFRGRAALPPVQTADWQLPIGSHESPGTRSADAYKLGLIVLRLFARSHDARALAPHARHVPAELRELLSRALAAHPANRPPAGEWQRALRELVARGMLSQRYPGPAPSRLVRPTPPPAAHPKAPRPVRGLRPTPSNPPALASPNRNRANSRSNPATVAWLVAAVVLFVLLFGHALAGVAPTSGGSNFNSGPSGGAQGSGFQYYYQRGPSSFGR